MTNLHLIAVSLLAAGCSTHDGMDMLSDRAAAMDVHLAASSLELDRHRVAVEAAGTLDEVAAEEAAHEADMMDHDLAMRHEVDDMMGCMDRTPGAMGAMMDDLEGMAGERSAHVDRMTGAHTRGDALQEEAAHHARMAELMADAGERLGAMMDGADMPCSHHD